jgi:hypothetical protein
MEEVFKDIEGYEGLYQVSNLGRVKSLIYQGVARDRILKAGKDSQGYLLINLYKLKKPKSSSIHRLVASAFLPNEDCKSQVNHLDANKENNNVNNLEWSTPAENINHAINLGLMNRQREKTKEAHSIPVIDKKTQIIYESIKIASENLLISATQLSRMLKGICPNKTSLEYYNNNERR